MNRGGKCWRCNGKGIVRPKKSEKHPVIKRKS
jgi:hypothetical protein